jgi:hypothetical protein
MVAKIIVNAELMIVTTTVRIPTTRNLFCFNKIALGTVLSILKQSDIDRIAPKDLYTELS